MKCPTCGYEFKTETDRKDAIYWCPKCGTMQRVGKVSVPKSAARGTDARLVSGLLGAMADDSALVARFAKALQTIARGDYDNAHDVKAAAKIASAALAGHTPARGTDADAGLVAKLVMACEAAFVLICNESGHPNGAVKNFGTMEGREVWYGKAAEVRATIRAALKLARGA